MLNLYAVVLTVIVAALLTVSIWQMRKVHTKADYLVAGRSLPAYVLVFTLLSSWIGAGSLFAGAENAFRNGFAALWQPAGGWLGLLIIYFVAPRARKFAQFTIPDLLEARYNTAARILGTIAILFAYTAITSYQFRAGGDIMHLIFPALAKTQGTLIIAGFVIVFTALAGMASVAYMDVVIGMLISVIGFIALPVLFGHIGGWAGLHHALPASHFTAFGEWGLAPGQCGRNRKEALIRALEYFLPTFLLMIGNQSMYQKFFSAKSEKDASVAVVGWVFGTVVLETLIVSLAVIGSGLFALSLVPAPDFAPREIIPFAARHFLPPMVGALLMGAVFAKVISTANNYLFSPANEPDQRCVYTLHPSERRTEERAAGLAICGGWPGNLGVGAGHSVDLGAGQGDVCVHNLFGGNHSGGDGRVLLASCDARGRGGLPALRNGDHRGLGPAEDPSAEGRWGT